MELVTANGNGNFWKNPIRSGGFTYGTSGKAIYAAVRLYFALYAVFIACKGKHTTINKNGVQGRKRALYAVRCFGHEKSPGTRSPGMVLLLEPVEKFNERPRNPCRSNDRTY